jgi:hypothetical protein
VSERYLVAGSLLLAAAAGLHLVQPGGELAPFMAGASTALFVLYLERALSQL